MSFQIIGQNTNGTRCLTQFLDRLSHFVLQGRILTQRALDRNQRFLGLVQGRIDRRGYI